MLDNLSAFHFLRPEWLWLLLPAGLLYLVVHRREDAVKRWKTIIAPELLSHLLITRRRRWRFRPVHSASLTLAFASVALAGPTWTREQPPFTEDKAPLVIALDLSREMDAIDIQPTRLERAKLKIHDLMRVRQGSPTALFVYAADAHMVLPLTADAGLMDLYAQALSTDLIAPGRKDTAGALRKIEAFMKNEAVPGSVLFITCGIERAAFSAFDERNRESREQILVLGIGTVQGGPVRTASGQFLAAQGNRIFSKLDLSGLKALKDQADIPISTVTLDDDDVNWVQRRATSHLQAAQQNDAQLRWVDEGYWLVIPVGLLTALWFRKGWAIRWSSAAVSLLFLTNVPHADARALKFIDLWLTPDQQGRYYYQKGDYSRAAENFRDPMWKGISLSHKGDYEAALNTFALVDTPEAWFNQGNSLAHLKRFPEAVHAYSEALKERPHWREAEDNLALVSALIPPPPKKSKEEQEEAPILKPDEIKFDNKAKKGKKASFHVRPEQMADIWMRNIQTSPADFLRRKFVIETAQEKRK